MIHRDRGVGVLIERVAEIDGGGVSGYDRICVADLDPRGGCSDRGGREHVCSAAEGCGRCGSDPHHEWQRRVRYPDHQMMNRIRQRGARVELDDRSRCARQGGRIDPVRNEVDGYPVEVSAYLDYLDLCVLIVGHDPSGSGHQEIAGDHDKKDRSAEVHSCEDVRWPRLLDHRSRAEGGLRWDGSAESLQLTQ